jgi:hypothetical protein
VADAVGAKKKSGCVAMYVYFVESLAELWELSAASAT